MYTIKTSISEKTETGYININEDTQACVFMLALYIKSVFGRDFNINAEFFRVDGGEVLSIVFHQENEDCKKYFRLELIVSGGNENIFEFTEIEAVKAIDKKNFDEVIVCEVIDMVEALLIFGCLQNYLGRFCHPENLFKHCVSLGLLDIINENQKYA